MAADVEKYSRLDTPSQEAFQADLVRVLEEAAVLSGLDRTAWERQPQGDQEFAVLRLRRVEAEGFARRVVAGELAGCFDLALDGFSGINFNRAAAEQAELAAGGGDDGGFDAAFRSAVIDHQRDASVERGEDVGGARRADSALGPRDRTGLRAVVVRRTTNDRVLRRVPDSRRAGARDT